MPNFQSLDNGPWGNLVQFLSPEDIQALKLVCQQFNKSLDELDVAWWPFLNRLHDLDKTISATPAKGQTIKQTFIEGLEKAGNSLRGTIEYLREHNGNDIFNEAPHIQAIHSKKTLTLRDIELIKAELDTITISLEELSRQFRRYLFCS